jgi:transporter family protein
VIWLWLALLSAGALAIYDVSKKLALHDNAVLPTLLASTLSGGLALSLVLGLAQISGHAARLGLQLQPLSAMQHGLVAAKAMLVSASWALSFFAVKHLPISLAAPLRASGPLLTLLGAFVLLAERPSGPQWAGIVLALIGYFSFGVLGRLEGVRFEANRWVLLLALAMILGSASGVYDKYLLQRAALPPTTHQVWYTAYNGDDQAFIVAFWWPRRKRTTPFRFRGSMLLVGALLVLADQLYFRALATPGALVSIVSVVRRASVILTFGVGGWLLREQLLGKKAIALAFILAGLVGIFVG